MTTTKQIGLVIAGAVIGFLVSVLASGNMFGGVYSNVINDFSEGISVDGTVVIDGSGNVDAPLTSSSMTIGASGTAASRVNFGTCYIRPYAATIAASSTAQADCQATLAWGASGASALTGVSYGDTLSMQLSTTTAGTTFQGVKISGAHASSTSGYIVLYLVNETGATFTYPTTLGTASGTAMYIALDN